MKPTTYALADANNFYCSCEQLFAPHLKNKPVAVLSNNDGCVIARSNEVKPLIPMGAPIHQWQHVIEQHHIQVFSANFALYGELSARVMSTLARFTHRMEVYSVDEAFLDFSAVAPESYTSYAKEIKQTVFKWIGIPVSIGVGATKTLAKIANKAAKRGNEGVLALQTEAEIDSCRVQHNNGIEFISFHSRMVHVKLLLLEKSLLSLEIMAISSLSLEKVVALSQSGLYAFDGNP